MGKLPRILHLGRGGWLLFAFLGWGAWANPVLDWNAVMMSAVRSDTTGPTLSSRNLAILHLALYDAVNSIRGTHQPYAVRVAASPGASVEAAVMAAGREVLRVLYPGAGPKTESLYQGWLDRTVNEAATTEGIEVGVAVARQLLDLRSNDGATTDVPYIPRSEPGQWRRTPPFFRPPLTPGWRYVRPFALLEVERFVPPPPPGLGTSEYARDWDEVRRLGRRVSEERTAEQGQIAVFWSDFSYTAMPPGHWYEIAGGIAKDRGTGLEDTARLLALLSLAQADAAIVCWEAKFRYNFWRPVTAIQRADEDGNPATSGDSGWDHLLAAPSFPAYPSGHSTFSKASSEVLSDFYGTDAIAFSAQSDSLPGMTRTFQSLSACADEVGLSRIYGGIHFGFDNLAGKQSGLRVAREVLAHWLLPVERLPSVSVERAGREGIWVRLQGLMGTPVVLESSPDLVAWSVVTNALGRPGGVRIPVTTSGQVGRFFRVRS